MIRRYWGLCLAVATAICAAGCAVAKPPIENPPQVVATPLNGQMSVSVDTAKPVGDVQPVHVSIANGTDIARAVVPNQIFAINESGERVGPLPPGEAARQAGGAGELKASIESAAVSGVGAGAIGAGIGAAAGSLSGGAGPGAIIGSAVGLGYGIFDGAREGQNKADSQATEQINALALQQQDVEHNFSVSGYVFFPKGQYKSIQVLMVNRESGDTEIVERPWP
jgi:hypothetical protein